MTVSLVTGGQGFIGARLARALLARGEKVRVADQADPTSERSGLRLAGIADQVEVVTGDLRDPAVIERALAGTDSVFHLAAQTLVGPALTDPQATFSANIQVTWQLLEAARRHRPGCIVIASSDKAYGPSEALPYREAQTLQPASPYEASKAAADLIALSYFRCFGLPVAVTRFANVYGGGDLNFSRLVPELMAAVVAGRRPVIRSDGSPERDFLHVDDAAAAYLAIEAALAESPGDRPAAGQAFNAGGGRPWSVRQILELLAGATGRQIDPDFRGTGSPDGEIDRQFVDPAKLTGLTGWRARVTLESGLARTYDWYEQHRSLLP